MSIAKSIALTIGIIVDGLVIMLVLAWLEKKVGIQDFRSVPMYAFGGIFLMIGTALRFWAALTFYKKRLKVGRLKAQHTLARNGPFRFSRNPLYIGILCISIGLALMFGSVFGIVFTVILFGIIHIWVIYGEEKYLQSQFGDEYMQYTKEVPRWIDLSNSNKK